MSTDIANTSSDGHESTVTSPAIREIPLQAITHVINNALAYIDKHARGMVEMARTVGQNLILAKERVPHGDWESWITNKTSLTVRNAQSYMQLARKFETLSSEEAKRVALLPLREVFKRFAVDGDASLANAAPGVEGPYTESENEEIRVRFIDAMNAMKEKLDGLAEERAVNGEFSAMRLRYFRLALQTMVGVVRKLERHGQCQPTISQQE